MLAVCILLQQGGYCHEEGSRVATTMYSSVSDPLGFSQMLKMPLGEVLSFLNKERLHINQGFFPDLQESYLLGNNVTYDGDFLKALVGAQLKSNEFLKIEQTYLADVITEEPGNEYYRYSYSPATCVAVANNYHYILVMI